MIVLKYFLLLLESCFFLCFWEKKFFRESSLSSLFSQCWLFVISGKNAVFCFGFLEEKLSFETTVCSLLYAKSYCSIVTSQHNHVNKLSLWINEGECFINNNDKMEMVSFLVLQLAINPGGFRYEVSSSSSNFKIASLVRS